MSKAIRFILAVSIFTISVALLVWSLWPAPLETRVINIAPAELALPTAGE